MYNSSVYPPNLDGLDSILVAVYDISPGTGIAQQTVVRGGHNRESDVD